MSRKCTRTLYKCMPRDCAPDGPRTTHIVSDQARISVARDSAVSRARAPWPWRRVGVRASQGKRGFVQCGMCVNCISLFQMP